MKTTNVLALVCAASLFAFGCSDSVIVSDGGVDGAAKADTNTTVADTAVPTDTATTDAAVTETTAEASTGDATATCAACRADKCSAKETACAASDASVGACQKALDCVNKCTSGDSPCLNACINDVAQEASDLIGCITGDCKTPCKF